MKARKLSEMDAQRVCDLYRRGRITIHGAAAVYNVAIGTIKKTLDEGGVPHNKTTGVSRRNANQFLRDLLEHDPWSEAVRVQQAHGG